MDPKKNKTLLGIFVTVMIVGLVGAYAPLVFRKPQIIDEPDYSAAPPQTASLVPPAPAGSTTVPSGNKIKSEGFSGLKEESQSVKDLDKFLGN